MKLTHSSPAISREMSQFLRFLILPAWQQWLLIQVASLLIATRVALQIAGYKRTRALLDLTARSLPLAALRAGNAAAETSIIMRMIQISSDRQPYASSCLNRSLVLWYLLRRRGVKPELRIGGRKRNAKFEAHAWVELDGFPLDPSDAVKDFRPFMKHQENRSG